MILPTSLILKAYPTLIEGRATRDTCQLLNRTKHNNNTCEQCIAFSNDNVLSYRCSFNKPANPDYDQMFKLFYDEYPELCYMIKPQALTQPGWYMEHFASKSLLVFIPSVEYNCITIQDYNKDIQALAEEEEYAYNHLKTYAYTYICGPMPLSEFENLYPEYFI